MKKRFLAAVMAAVVTLGALTGCGSSSESASAGTSSSGQRTVEDIKAAGKLKLNKIAARWPAKAVAQFYFY